LEAFTQALIGGLTVGAIYGLMCVGLAMIFGVMKVINFAQGDFMMMGMYATFYIFVALGLGTAFGPVFGPYVALLLAGPLLYIIGYLAHLLLMSRVSGTRTTHLEEDGRHAQLVLTLGLSLILENGAQIIFGSHLQSIPTPLSSVAWQLIDTQNHDFVIFLNKARGIAALISVATIVALVVLVNRTRLGKSLRAAADSAEAATFVGIDVDRCHRTAFGLGSAITAIAGGLLAANYPFHPFVGLEFVIIMYAGVVLGGVGSIAGAFWGGLTIGMVQQLSTLVLPTQLQNTAIFVVFLLVVFFRPQGLFGRVVERT
jgi:branched-chain amino acid transport system permease protein